jgi:hypothetical protein
VKREITPIIYTGSLLCKLGSFGTAKEGTEALAKLM